METSHLMNSTAKLSNSINTIGYAAFNSKGTITRNDILSSYSTEALSAVWKAVATFVIKNYQSGKGTFIKGFGTFTFTNIEYSLEGTTNQFNRDIKLRRPVFIMSPEFVEGFRPGQYTKTGGLIYYTQKPNNSIGIVKLNLAELSYGVSITKEEFANMLHHLIKDMSEQIKSGTFKNRELPGLGVFMVRANVFGMKFINEFNNEVMRIPQKLIFTKKNIGLFMDTTNTNGAPMDDLPNAEKAMDDIRAKTSVITKITQNGERWLQNKMDINLQKDILNSTRECNNNSLENTDHTKRFTSKDFFTSKLKSKSQRNFFNNKETSFITKNNGTTTLNKLIALNLPCEILEAIVCCKGQIIKEMKVYDRRNNGIISKFELIRSLNKANVHPSLPMNVINDIVNIYTGNIDYVEYSKIITCLLKEVKIILKENNINYDYGTSSSTNNNNNNSNDSSFNKSFNNKFKLGPNQSMKRSMSSTAEFGAAAKKAMLLNEYKNLVVNVDEVENEIKSIKIIFQQIMQSLISSARTCEYKSFLPSFDKKISYVDLNVILHKFSITYTVEKIFKILKYIHIDNPTSFTLETFNTKLNQCKVTTYEMTSEQLNAVFNRVNDIITANGGKSFLFTTTNSTNNKEPPILSLQTFISLLKPKVNYSTNILSMIFNKLTSGKDSITLNEYISKYENTNTSLTVRYYDDSCTRIKHHIKQLKITTNDYYNILLSYNYLRDSNTLTKEHFVLAMLQEPYTPPFTEEQLAFIYSQMDNDHNNRVDRNEFKKAINREQDSLIKMQDIVKRLNLEINDLAFRLQIKKDVNEKLTFYQFKTKMRNMDCTFTNEFIESIYVELCGSLENTLHTFDLFKALNVFKKENFITTNTETFKTNFISNIQSSVDYHTLKTSFEHVDKMYNGKISKAKFCDIINRFTSEFNDEDIMKFVRITNLTDPYTYEVIYTNFLNLIYYNAKLDLFLICIDELKKLLVSPTCNNDINKLITHINNSNVNYTTTHDTAGISLDTMLNYLKSCMPSEYKDKLFKTTISKFDLDADGRITYNDIKGIVLRYMNTHFFKYENNEKGALVNLYNTDKLSDDEFKKIVKEIKTKLKMKNINDVGLFKKLDKDGDGFISNYDFSIGLGNIMEIAPAIKDKLFDYIDYYKNGQVDLETFLLRFKEFKSSAIVIENNNKIENEIINAFAEWLSITNDKLTDTEIFALLDNDKDGLISLQDFRYFVIDSLKFSLNEINDYKLERVMQSISLTKNKNIGLGDIKEFITRIHSRSGDTKHHGYYVDLKETFKETKNQNLYKDKKNLDWIASAIEKFGMFISERFGSLEEFYSKYADGQSGKFKYDNFEEFHKKNYECFYGFNLTKDELIAIYTSLDSQKKNFLTIDDLKHKLNLFDFYKKMHFDVKTFITKNFPTNVDAFKYFLTPNINNIISSGNNKPFRNYITKKEFFDGLNYLMPKKYTTDTILKYYNNYFVPKTQQDNSSTNNNNNNWLDQITFSTFSFVYYDIAVSNDETKMRRTYTQLTKLNTSRSAIFSKTKNGFSLPKQPFQTLPHPKLETPFDIDPLEKLRKLIHSSSKDYLTLIRKSIIESGNGIVNQYEFRNIIKSLGLGLTSVEIETIINTSGKTRDNKINLNDFYKFVANDDKNLIKAQLNIKSTLADIKQLLYKYYSNPKLAFEFSDNNKTNQMDFDTFKCIIGEMYKRECKQTPNFALLKETFDVIDLRKDGYIDMNEWTNSFGRNKGKLDLITNKKQVSSLRQWETSDGVIAIYKAIAHNKKVIWDKVKGVSFGKGNGAVVQEDNLIKVLKEVFPDLKLTNTQWKMIVEIADKDPSTDLIHFEQFIKIVEHCATKAKSQPRI